MHKLHITIYSFTFPDEIQAVSFSLEPLTPEKGQQVQNNLLHSGQGLHRKKVYQSGINQNSCFSFTAVKTHRIKKYYPKILSYHTVV